MGAGATTVTPLLTSKLTVPSTPPGMIDRPRLHRLLDKAAGKALTIVSAPAGWGKTVLLSTWATAVANGDRTGWLTAEPDDSADEFWRYLDAGLRQATPTTGDDDRDVTVADLAHTIARLPEPVTMIVDELDRVTDQGVWEGLEYLLRHATERLRLIAATRTEPPVALHRWRLRGELTQVGFAELAFTQEETAEVIAGRGLVLPAANLCDLQRRTEGWPAGVWLAASRIMELPTEARRVGRPGGDDPHIGAYFLTEVLDGQPSGVQDTLLCASVLERISSSLLEAVTGRVDGERLLAQLARDGTFLAPLDRSPTWYRLNPLFSEALRVELGRRYPSRTPGLHTRAARWFAERNLAAEALRHALASGDRQLISQVLDEHWYRMLPSSHRGPGAIEIGAPPNYPVREDPEVALAYAASRFELHDGNGAEPYLRLAGRHGDRVASDRRDQFALMAAAFRLGQAQLRGDVPAMSAIAGDMLVAVQRRADAPQAHDDAVTAIALTAMGTAHLMNGELASAERALRGGTEYAVAAGLPCEALVGQSRLAYTLALRGELGIAGRTAWDALESAWCPGPTEPVHCAHAYLALAVVALQRGQVREAQSNVDLAASVWDHTTEPALTPTLALVQAEVLLESGEWARGHDTLLAARRSVPEHRLTAYLGNLVLATEADLLTAHGEPGAARDLLAPVVGDATAGPALRVSYARACLRDRDPRAAASAVPSWSDNRGADDQLPVRLAAGLIQAEAARRIGDGNRASASLERVLVLAEPEDFRRVFTGVSAPSRDLLLRHLDSGTVHWSFLTDVLGARDLPGRVLPGVPQALPESLTERELTVLRYLQSLLSNVEIATELCVSVNTVKTHVRNIYRKLSATHRRDAVRRARELQLL